MGNQDLKSIWAILDVKYSDCRFNFISKLTITYCLFSSISLSSGIIIQDIKCQDEMSKNSKMMMSDEEILIGKKHALKK